MKRFHLVLISFAMVALIFTACKKDDNTVAGDNDTKTSEYDALAESTFDDATNIADEAYDLSTGGLKSTETENDYLGDCATVTLDTISMPHVLTIDFGEVNCLCNDGRYRRGKIIITFTGRYREPGSVRTHGFDNYYVDDNKIEGSKVLTNMGFNDNGNIWFTIEVEGTIILADETENGGIITWNASKQREWVEGYETFRRRDDVYLITGTASGVAPSGFGWSRVITNALRRELSCRFFVSGTIEITPENKPVRILDFGDGECDNIATVTINGKTHTIFLR